MERTFETSAPPRLDLRIAAGRVDVDAGASSLTEIRLDASEEARERATVEQRGDTILVDVPERWSGLLGGRSREVRLVVRCPEGATLAARTKSADVMVRGRLAAADVSSASGDVELDAVDGKAAVKTASGDVEVRSAGSLAVNTASGDLSAGVVRGELRVNVVSGDVAVGTADADVGANSVSGDIEIRCATRGAVRLQSVSGDVEVGIRRGSRVHVEAATLSGDTRSELELSGEPEPAADDGPLVDLVMKSVSGDLTVVRAPETQPQEVHRP